MNITINKTVYELKRAGIMFNLEEGKLRISAELKNYTSDIVTLKNAITTDFDGTIKITSDSGKEYNYTNMNIEGVNIQISSDSTDTTVIQIVEK